MSIIGHGIDLVDVERIEDMLDRHGERFLDRCFTVREQAYCESGGVQRAQRYAARFAAKEAVFKAIGTGLGEGMTWTSPRSPMALGGVGIPGRTSHHRA